MTQSTAPTPHQLRRCPSCRKDVLHGWVDCIHCGAILPPAISGDWGSQVPVYQTGTTTPGLVGFILSLLWLGGIGSIIGICLGISGRREVDRSGGLVGGRGLATAAMWIGWAGLVVPVLLLFAIAVAALGSAS